MKTLTKLFVLVLLTFATLSLRSAETAFDFEDGAGLGGQLIGDHYFSMGLSFDNAAWVAEGTFGVGSTPGQWRDGAAGFGPAVGCYHDSNYWWQSPCPEHPITITFLTLASSVSVTSFNPGINGVRLNAYDSLGNLVGSDQFIGDGAGTGTTVLQVTSASTPIHHITLDQPEFIDSNDDGVTFDNLSFTPVSAGLDFAGFFAPIGGADSSGGSFESPVRTFKMNSTIPVKFSISSGGVPVVTGVHTLTAVKYSDATTFGTPLDATPQDAATSGNEFRLSGEEWHFNLSTKATGMSVGIWKLTATLSDGSQHTVWIQLK